MCLATAWPNDKSVLERGHPQRDHLGIALKGLSPPRSFLSRLRRDVDALPKENQSRTVLKSLQLGGASSANCMNWSASSAR